MTPQQDIAREIWEIFAEPTPEKRARYEQFRLQEAAVGRRAVRFFSEFRPAHLDLAETISTRFADLVSTAPTEVDGLRAVVHEYRRLEPTTHPDLLYHALRVFVTHHHGSVDLEIPSILVTDPELVAPSEGDGSQRERDSRLAVAAGSPEETRLDWFREDPLLNEHHAHWHVVYTGNNPLERQGEMFFYMHRQMLARYNAERTALTISPVKAYDDFRQPIKVGYAPGPDVRLGRTFDDRAPNLGLLDGNDVSDQRTLLTDIRNDLLAGTFDVTAAVNEIVQADRLGSTIEPNARALPGKTYRGYHGFGHVAIADSDLDGRFGVMARTTTAIRDVVFWEWHQGIDDIYGQWQTRLQPYNFRTDAPKTLLRKSVDTAGQPFSPDLIVCKTASLPTGITPEQAGTLLFGGANWNTDFGNVLATANNSAGQPIRCQTTNALNTRMQSGTIRFTDVGGVPRAYNYPFVNHDPFSLFIRVENKNPVKTTVTVRVFLVPDTQAEDRTKWIELDKFLADLNPLEKKVIYRADTASSVIRKPAVTNPATNNTAFDPTNINAANARCNCGYPYHMLLPRGTTAGMKFRLMVMLTNADIDIAGQQANCASLSFCGTRNQNYPDRRPLGYPFNRPFATPAGIAGTIAGQDNMASRVITIKQV